MPNKKISQLDQITSITGTEQVPIVQNGLVKRTTTGAFTGRLKELARASNSVAIQDAKEIARATLLDGLSAGSITQQDLSGIALGLHRSPSAVTAMFVYDTSKDSDGGAWTKRCQNTSWYNEPLSGKWLGAQDSELNARNEGAILGSELWSTSNTVSISYTGTARVSWDNTNSIFTVTTGGTSQVRAKLEMGLVAGKLYKISYNFTGSLGGVQNQGTTGSFSTSNVFSGYFIGSESGIYIRDPGGTTLGGTLKINSLSVKEVITTSTNAGDYYQDSTTGRFYKLNKNLLTGTAVLATQTQWLTAGTYTISSTTSTSGSVAISGAATATHTAGTPTTFTVATSGNVTFTVTGSVLQAQVETGSIAYEYRANTTTRVTEVFRGNKAEFPTLSAIVAEAGSITIYDLTESGRPMWMRFINIANDVYMLPPQISCINAIQGTLYVGNNYGANEGINNGVRIISFIADNAISTVGVRYCSPLSGRNQRSVTIASSSPVITNLYVQSIALTVFLNSKIDPISGLNTPTVAVATNAGIFIIKDNNVVYNSTQTSSFNKVQFTDKGLIASRTSDSTFYYYPKPANISANFTLLTESSDIDFNQGTTTTIVAKNKSEIARIATNKIQLLKHNETTVGKGLAATITPTYNTGYMPGDIRRSYMTSTNQGIQTSVSGAVRSLFLKGEQGVWYDPSDLSTLFQDSAGTTPVTAVEQPVGLMLDKSNRNRTVQTYTTYASGTPSSYLNISNTQSLFGSNISYTIEGWFKFLSPTTTDYANFVTTDLHNLPNRWDIDVGVTSSTTNLRLVTEGNAVVFTGTSMSYRLGDWVHLAVVNNVAANTLTFYVNGVAAGSRSAVSLTSRSDIQLLLNPSGYGGQPYYASNIRILNNIALYSGNFMTPKPPLSAITGTSLLTCQSATFVDNSINAFSITAFGGISTSVGSVSIGGNHAFQTTDLNKPTLSARYNLLTKTEDFSDGVWSKSSLSTAVNTTVTSDPLGGSTADIFTCGSSQAEIAQSAVNTASQVILSCYAKKSNSNYVFLQVTNVISGPNAVRQFFNITPSTIGSVGTTQVFGTGFSKVSASILSVGDDWFKLSLTVNIPAANCAIAISPSTTDAPVTNTLATSVYLWGADLRVANDGVGIPGYQRVNTGTDYEIAGFPKYLSFDGTNSFLQTNNIDFSATGANTDKMTVFVGVRYTSATTGNVVELSADYNGNPGSFYLFYYGGWQSTSRGSATASASQAVTTGGVQVVLSTTHSISDSTTTLRSGGNVLPVATGNKGTGVFGKYPLYIGRRGGTSNPFNGRIYSLIVRGASTSDSQLAAVERYLDDQMTRSINNTLQITTDTLTQPNGDPIFVSIINKE